MSHIFIHQLRLHFRKMGDLTALLLFFIICFSLFPFAVGPNPETLKKIAPGIIWISTLFTIQLALPKIYAEDFEDGSLETLILYCPALELAIFARSCAFCLVIWLPLIIITPLASLIFDFDRKNLILLMFSLVAGSFSLIQVGGTAAALALGSRQASFLTPLLTLPFFIPILIFGVAAIEAAINDLPVRDTLILLSGLALFFLPLCTMLTAVILRQIVQD